jgi:pimeloyl-ACP methyl ester carboxylesterase
MLRAFAAGRLFGRAYGSPPPRVLALHGWARSSQDFAALLDGLDGVALDLPGFGATPAPPEPWGASEYADAVRAVVEELSGPPLVVVGHSFGGRVAVHLAAVAPDRIAALVLTGVPLLRRTDVPRPRPAPAFRLGKALYRRGLLSEERMEALRRRYGSTDYRAARGVMRDVHVRVVNESYDEQLRAIRCPVELVWGDDDDQVPVAVARAAQQLLPTARLTTVPGAGHLVPVTASGELREAVVRHLR